MQGNKPNVAQLLLHYLNLEGMAPTSQDPKPSRDQTKYVFGIPGAAIKTLLKTLEEPAQKKLFQYVVCRHESGAAFIADGYYRATGRPGVVAVTSGPGATNALTGTLTAESGGSAVITITGEVSEGALGRGYLQEGLESGLNIPAIYTAATRYSAYLTDPSSAKTLIEQALREAMSIPRHAVHLSMPENIAAEMYPKTYAKLPDETAEYRAVPGGRPRSQDIDEVCNLIHQSKRPLILLGQGCRDAMRDPSTAKALKDLVHMYAIPVMTTVDAKGLFPEDDPYSFRSYGCASCRWPSHWLDLKRKGHRCDALLVIGSALGNLSTNWWHPMLIPSPPGPFIQVDVDQRAIGRAFNITHGIVADAGEFIQLLSACLLQRGPNPNDVEMRKAAIDQITDTLPFAQKTDYKHPNHCSNYMSHDDTKGIEPAALIRVVQEVLNEEDRDTMIFIDAGNCVGWGAHYFVVKDKIEYHSNLRMGPMGFGVAGVIGAKIGKNALGKKDCDCLALVGDGAFLMHGAEVSTASAHKVGAIWIVLAEDDLRMVTQGMSWWTGHNFDGLYSLGNADLVKYAEGLGANAVEVKAQGELKAALHNALQAARGESQEPQAIIARINPERVPPYYIPPYEPPIQRDFELASAMVANLSP
jgi:acetolactate synthase-1/2/3 large subunit